VAANFSVATLAAGRPRPVRPSVIKTSKMDVAAVAAVMCIRETEWGVGGGRMANLSLGLLGNFRLETNAGAPVLLPTKRAKHYWHIWPCIKGSLRLCNIQDGRARI
jgi:hypothetical protein